MRRYAGDWTVIAVLLGILIGSTGGCASDSRRNSSPSSSEVRKDSDRFFERMKEDERSRGETGDRRP